MYEQIFKRGTDGKVIATKPFIAYCGCSSATVAVDNALNKAKIKRQDVVLLKTAGNRLAKDFLTDNGFGEKAPSLKNHQHAVLIVPETGEAIDFFKKDKEKLDKEVRRIYGRLK